MNPCLTGSGTTDGWKVLGAGHTDSQLCSGDISFSLERRKREIDGRLGDANNLLSHLSGTLGAPPGLPLRVPLRSWGPLGGGGGLSPMSSTLNCPRCSSRVRPPLSREESSSAEEEVVLVEFELETALAPTSLLRMAPLAVSMVESYSQVDWKRLTAGVSTEQ